MYISNRNRLLLLGALLCSAAVAQQTQNTVAVAAAAVPNLIRFAGSFHPANPPAGPVGGTFAIYSDQEGGTPLWTEEQNVELDANGNYTVLLGSAKNEGVPAQLFPPGEARWLQVKLYTPAEVILPRVLLASVPYAMKAGDAATVGGLPPSAFVLAAPAAMNADAVKASASLTPAATPSTSTGTTDYIPIWTDSTGDLGNSVIYQSGTGATAKIGVNITTPATTLDVKGTGTIRGSLTLPSIGAATATTGYKSQPLDLAASAFSSSTSAAVKQTFQWQAEPVGNDTATAGGSLNLLYGSGTATPAETGLSVASNGVITFAPTQTFPGGGGGTITGVTAGTDLTGGGTSGNVTLNVDTTKVVTGVTAGADLTGGGTGGALTLNLDTTKVPLLSAGNTFTGNQTVNGNLSATGVVTGSSFQIGSNLFGFGSYANFNAFLGYGGNTTMTGGSNTSTGYQALFHNTTGYNNTVSGTNALLNNSTGWMNTGTGSMALYNNSTGNYNAATGTQAGYYNTTGANNTAMGTVALYHNITGSNNTALGAGADVGTDGLTNATAIGSQAYVMQSNSLVLGAISGFNNATASTNVGIGTPIPQYALDVHGTGNFTGLVTFAPGQTFPGAGGTITGVTAGTDLTGGGTSGTVTLNVDTTKVVTGVAAGADLTGGGTGGALTLNLDTTKVPLLSATNVFTGNQTVNGNLSATGAVTGSSYQIGSNVFGYGSYMNGNAFLGFAGNTQVTGTSNTAIGFQALSIETTGFGNTAVGSAALDRTTTGINNTAVGASALASNQAGRQNTAVGAMALNSALTGGDNTAVGYQALNYSMTNQNTAVGSGALQFDVGDAAGDGAYNTAVGYQALYANSSTSGSGTEAQYNGAVGWEALFSNTTGSTNAALGAVALFNNTTGGGNTAGGWSALYDNNSGNYNTAAGYQALSKNTTGNNNTAIGYLALGSETSGASNTALGYLADVGVNNLSDSTAIGTHAYVTQSESLVLGSVAGVNGACCTTNVGIGTSAPSRIFTIGQGFGHAIADGWDTYSSRRWKTNIQTLDGALAKVEQLRGVSYDLKDSGKHEIGVIAEEVGAVVPEVVTYEKNGTDAQGVDYSRLTALLIEATKQQQKLIQQQQEQIRAQQAQIDRLTRQVRTVKAALKAVNRPGSELHAVRAEARTVQQ
jgi:hypothetical protein